MKTIKQKLLHSKFAILAVLFSAFILLVSGGFMTKIATAEGTQAKFSVENFVMLEGAEVRTDGEKTGIRFVASLGNVLPTEEDYPNLKYNVMIVPKQYVEGITDNYYEQLDSKYDYIASMVTEPFLDEELRYGKEGYYYIRGTLSNVKFNNINVEWFGIAYLTYTNAEGGIEYIYAEIPETGANVRSLVYCASGYLNKYDYTNDSKTENILLDFVAQGINKASGETFTEENKSNRDKLKAYVASLKDAEETTNLLPEKTAECLATMPEGVKLHVAYDTEDKTYATVSEAGVIKGVEGDGNAKTKKNVTMKILGASYNNPVHVYKVETALANATEEIFSKGGTIGDIDFADTAELTFTAKVDNVDVDELTWKSGDETAVTVSDGVATAKFQKAMFESKQVDLSFSFSVGKETVESEKCSVKVSFPIAYQNAPLAYGDLMQNVFNDDSTDITPTTEAVNMTALGDNFGTVTNFLSEDLSKELLENGKTNANVYGSKEAGEKNFIVVSQNGYAYKVKATVVSYAIGNNTKQLDYFFSTIVPCTSYEIEENATHGTYVILSGDVTGYTYYYDLHSKSTTALKTYYEGTFDGRGHKITIDTSAKKYCTAGFFGYGISYDGVIKNLAIINYMKNSSAGGGLAYTLTATATIDNCYLQLISYASSNAMGGIAYNGRNATITNTIVNVTTSSSTSTSNKATICVENGGNTTGDNVQNCYSITVSSSKVKYSVGTSTGNVYSSANALLDVVIKDNKPINGFNSYWTYENNEFKFGGNVVLEYTQTTTAA